MCVIKRRHSASNLIVVPLSLLFQTFPGVAFSFWNSFLYLQASDFKKERKRGKSKKKGAGGEDTYLIIWRLGGFYPLVETPLKLTFLPALEGSRQQSLNWTCTGVWGSVFQWEEGQGAISAAKLRNRDLPQLYLGQSNSPRIRSFVNSSTHWFFNCLLR